MSTRQTQTILAGTEHKTDLTIIDSGEPGPTTMIVAGVHGDELASIEAAKSFRECSIPRGKLVVLPMANTLAAQKGWRLIDLDADGTLEKEDDLNRRFPPSGECPDKVSKAVWGAVAEHEPDNLYDLHTSQGVYKRVEPGKGQAMFHNAAAASSVKRAATWVNQKFSLGSPLEFRTSQSVDGTDPMLVDRYMAHFDGATAIIETTDDQGPSVEQQREWQVCIVSTLLSHHDQKPTWETKAPSGAETPADSGGSESGGDTGGSDSSGSGDSGGSDTDETADTPVSEQPSDTDQSMPDSPDKTDSTDETVEKSTGGDSSPTDPLRAAVASVADEQAKQQVKPVADDVEGVKSDVGTLKQTVKELASKVEGTGAEAYEEQLRQRSNQPVINVVDEGLANDGTTVLDESLTKLATANTILFFPPGRYKLDQFSVGLKGVELHGYNATLVPKTRESMRKLIDVPPKADRFTLQGFRLRAGEGFPPMFRLAAPNWRVEDVVLEGDWGVRNYPSAMTKENNGDSVFNVGATSSDGVAVMRNVYAESGIPPTARDNRRFVFVICDDWSHDGTLRVENVWMQHWCENSWYGTYPTGTVEFKNCYVKNSPIGLRVGHANFDSCTFVKDGPNPGQRASLVGEEGWNRHRGIWLQGGDNSNPDVRQSTCTIRNCDFWFDDVDLDRTDAGPPILLGPPSQHTEIIDTRIYNRNHRWPAIQLDAKKWAYHPDRVPDCYLAIKGVDIVQPEPTDKPAINLGRGVTRQGTSGRVDAAGPISNIDWYGDGFQTPADGVEVTKATKEPPMPAPPAPGQTPNAR